METYNKLFKGLNAHDLILTANQRLASTLQEAYADYQQQQGKKVWITPLIITLSRWLELEWEKQLIKHSVFPYRLLTTLQEYIIWKTIIDRSSYAYFENDNTAKTAQEAWKLVHQWQLGYQSPLFHQTYETQQWQNWAKKFLYFSKAHACLDLCRATSLLTQLFSKGMLSPPHRVFVMGFVEINPQHKYLLETLEKKGCVISLFSPAFSPSKIRCLSQPNSAVEIETMARWAHQCWKKKTNRIGCIVPNLMHIRSQVIYTLTDVFTGLEKKTLNTPPFNVASGKRLREFSLIQTAFAIIYLKPSNPFHEISRLILSPYLGYSQQEQLQRAQLDIYLRQQYESTINLDQLTQASKEKHCPQLARLVERFILFFNDHLESEKKSPHYWVQHFVQKLQTLQWPGQRTLVSNEFQLIQRWSELLSELAELDFILGKITQETALKQLYQLANQTLFQAKTTHKSPIQILGLLDTTDLYFDRLWIMGLDDKTWPAASQRNPFIPSILQRQYQLPHSSNERELYFASLLTQCLFRSAPMIVLSYPLKNLDEPLRPSSLINKAKPIEASDIELCHYQSSVEQIRISQTWEYYTDDQAPLLASDTEKLSSKGSKIIQSQAVCPFQAFAHFRLNAHFDPAPQAGLNPRERGIILHEALEHFWNLLGNQSNLLKQSPEALTELIATAISRCMQAFAQKKPLLFKKQFMTIEQGRLQQRLRNTIELEKDRPSFCKSLHEKEKSYNLGKLSLQLRIDRIDEFEDGSQFIIDYKTGVPTSVNWLEERLEDPQLPLYCLAYSKTVRGFANLYIRSDGIQLQGITEKESGIPKLVTLQTIKTSSLSFSNWSALLTYWKSSLEKLADDFQQGVAKVDPKRGASTCHHCNLKLLCRIQDDERSD